MRDEAGDGQGSGPAASVTILKALAHPIRRAALRALDQLESARAADLAAHLDIPANKLSFHLRTLADAGLIKEDPSRARDRRDRVWVVVDQVINIGSPGSPVSDQALGDVTMRGYVDDHIALMNRVAAWLPEFTSGRDTEMRGMFTHSTARFTPAEFDALRVRLNEVIDEARDSRDKTADVVRLYEIDIVATDDTI